MREIFPPNPEHHQVLGIVFYTIRSEDVGKSVIDTEIGPIRVSDVIGRVLRIDVGKRLYRVPNDAGDWWYWQAENDAQFKQRTEKGKS